MKRAIICEGKTDAVLLGYLLSRRFGWRYLPRGPLELPADRRNEELNWYDHPDKTGDEIAVWGAGGIDAIAQKVSSIAERTRSSRKPEERFGRIVLLFDRDQRTEGECIALIAGWIGQSGVTAKAALELAKWIDVETQLEKTPPETHPMKLSAIV